MYALLLLATALVSNAAQAPAPADAASSPATTTIRWTVRGISHSLKIAATPSGDLGLVGREGEFLRSVVGPMMSTLHKKTFKGDSGTYRTLELKTETQGPYPFDLVSWLDASGQSGMALRQILESSTCDFRSNCGAPAGRWPSRPQCPSADSLAAYDGGLLEMSRLLVEAQCFTEEQVRIQPEAFWIDAWDGKEVTLAVQRERCHESTTACDGRMSFVTFRPPRRWNGWLEDAAAGKGYLPHAMISGRDSGPVQGNEHRAPHTDPLAPSETLPAPAPPEDGGDALPLPPTEL